MNKSYFRHMFPILVAICVAAALSGCKSKFEGKYVGVGNMITIEFKSGKATISDSSGGAPEIDDYTIDGDKITVKAKSGDIPFTLMQDGTIAAPWPIGSLKKAE